MATSSAERSETQGPTATSPESGGAAEDRLVGTILADRFALTRRIGQGGMGAVFEADHLTLDRKVAVKLLLDKHAETEAIVRRLEREARLASSIGHPNIVDILDFGQVADGRCFVVMEFLDGESLGACLAREGRLPVTRCLAIARQICSALEAAHEKNIVHRDIKPENIFLQRRGGEDFVKVVDFGISKTLPVSEEEEIQRLTQTGMVLGTPLYMAPEQARGEERLDPRIDVYSVGVILYEMVTGEVPFHGTNYLSILNQVMSVEPPPPSALYPELDRDLELVILRAIARDRDHRYQSMAELARDLRALEEGGAVTGARIGARRRARAQRREQLKRASLYAAAFAAALAVAALAVILAQDQPAPPAAESPATTAPPPPAEEAKPVRSKRVTMEVRSSPSGATVFRGDRALGQTPYPLTVAEDEGSIELVVRLEGYQDARATVRPDIDGQKPVEISLTPVVTKTRKRQPEKPSSDRGTQKSDPTGGDLPPWR